jgi:hypothetical protein
LDAGFHCLFFKGFGRKSDTCFAARGLSFHAPARCTKVSCAVAIHHDGGIWRLNGDSPDPLIVDNRLSIGRRVAHPAIAAVIAINASSVCMGKCLCTQLHTFRREIKTYRGSRLRVCAVRSAFVPSNARRITGTVEEAGICVQKCDQVIRPPTSAFSVA